MRINFQKKHTYTYVLISKADRRVHRSYFFRWKSDVLCGKQSKEPVWDVKYSRLRMHAVWCACADVCMPLICVCLCVRVLMCACCMMRGVLMCSCAYVLAYACVLVHVCACVCVWYTPSLSSLVTTKCPSSKRSTFLAQNHQEKVYRVGVRVHVRVAVRLCGCMPVHACVLACFCWCEFMRCV